jgi:plasmid stabilization system protein ParE
MTRRLVVRSRARLELAEASDWYDAQNAGLGDELLYAFDTALASVMSNPFQFQVVHGKARRAPLGKFPYRLIYMVTDEEVIILSCFHGRRDPKRWQQRL